MNLLRTLVNATLTVPYGWRKLTGTGAFGPHGATYVRGSAAEAGNGLKRALASHYVRQYSPSSCSVASIATVVNALRSSSDNRALPMGQLELLDRADTAHWKARISPRGYRGRRGLPLPLLGRIVQHCLDTFGIPHAAVEIVRADTGTGRANRLKTTLRQRLQAFERHGDGVVIAHFDQGIFVKALSIPHISPVGAFDADSGEVTVLDVDPDQPGPYRVSFGTFYRGLSSNYHHILRPFGYANGGYVWVGLS